MTRRQALALAATAAAKGTLVAVAKAALGAGAPARAEKLGEDGLTPHGAEKAGNASGTIPAWDGGYTTVAPGYKSGQPRVDPFAGDQPRMRITRQNLEQHASQLSAGMLALARRFPSLTFDVYPTRRTAAAPAWVYENIRKNAARARTSEGGLVVEGSYGGIPFPRAKTGPEAMWNHLLGWRGECGRYPFLTYVVASGTPMLATGATIETQSPYYFKEGDLKDFDGTLGLARLTVSAPPLRVGENLAVNEPVNQLHEGRKAWLYLVGQRRVRRAPTVSYDNPSSVSSGFTFSDESYLFNGAMDRYDWTLLGKQEMFIPYNTQKFHNQKISEVLVSNHPNPAHLRWELHRCWVVEAKLAPGKRHVVPRRRFYLDEDTWQAVLYDGWDARNQLWRTGYSLPYLAPELPAMLFVPYVLFDLIKNGYTASSLSNDTGASYKAVGRHPPEYFSPAALAAAGVR